MKHRHAAFTLIELLIVVAIIAILAAIAVPNFMEAQVRSKVSRVKADQRALATAIESYRIDYNRYPSPDFFLPNNSGFGHYVQYLFGLTTPVAYIASASMPDPFKPDRQGAIWTSPGNYRSDFVGSYWYGAYDVGVGGDNWGSNVLFPGFLMISWGPDRQVSYMEHFPMDVHVTGWMKARENAWPTYPANRYDTVYDPTNGTKSRGDVGRSGGMPNIPVVLGG